MTTGVKAKALSLLVAGLIAGVMVLDGCNQPTASAPDKTPETSALQGAIPVTPPPTEGATAVAPPPPPPPAKGIAPSSPKLPVRHMRKAAAKPTSQRGLAGGGGGGQAASSGSGATQQVESDSTKLEDALAKLKPGNLAYSTPTQMKMAQTAHIVAKIATDAVSAAALKAAMPSDAGTQTAMETTSTTPQMKMTLTSADFDITPLSSEEQIVAGSVPTTWEWDILPKHSGTLHLHLAAVIELHGKEKDFTTVDREITVKVDPADVVGGFIKTNWQWLIASLTAVVGAAWKFFAAGKKRQAAA